MCSMFILENEYRFVFESEISNISYSIVIAILYFQTNINTFVAPSPPKKKESVIVFHF